MSVRPHPDKRKHLPLFGKPTPPAYTAAMRMKEEDFKLLCMEAGVEPTKRQARRYNARRGRWAA